MRTKQRVAIALGLIAGGVGGCLGLMLSGATRYMAPNGTDSGPALTEATAWRTIAYALGNLSAFASGDTLMLCAGTNGNPGVGVWDGGDEPFSFDIDPGNSGTPSDWSYVIPDTGVTPIFDAAGRATQNRGIRFLTTSPSSRSERFEVKGIVFRDYRDLTGGSSEGNGTVAIAVTGNAVATGFRFIDLKFEAVARDTVDTAFQIFTVCGEPCADAVDSLLIQGCGGHDFGNAGATLYRTRGARIVGCRFTRPYQFMWYRTQDGPNGISMARWTASDTWITDCELSGWDHAVEVRGNGGLIARNVFHDLTDDFIYGNDGGGASMPTRDWVVEDNLFYHDRTDDGIEFQGKKLTIRHNTVHTVGDWLLQLGGTGGPDTVTVVGNIFDHSIASGDGDGNNGVLLGTGHSAISIVDNLFFDAEGPLQFMDEDDGGVTDLASFNAKSYAEGNIEALPNFVDTTRAPTRPYYSGVTLKPLSISPALNLGLWTRTAGAMPCGNCPTFGLSASGFVSDSAHVVWFDRNGVSGGFRYDAGLAPAAARGAWWVDVLPDSTAAGTLRATFSLFTGGDSLVAFDQVEIPHYPPALAEIIRDTVWAEPWIDHLGDQDMGSIVTDTHTRIASSGVRIARESTPAGAGVGELADSVWTRSDGRTLTPGAIVDETFADESIGMRALADPCIMSAEIGSGAIDADAIAADAIGASEIAADAVGAPEIATGAIGAAEIADNAIDAGAIAADAIGAAEVAAGTIGAAEVADGAIDAATFAAGAIDVAAIATDAIGAAEIAAGAIDEGAFATDAISARVIGNEAIGSSELKTGAIDADAIAADALGASELAADAVGEIGAAVDAQLSGTHGTGTWGAGVGLGGGLYTHTVHVVESGSGANIPGARLTVRDIPHTGGELADATTGTSGALTLHLDAGTYRAIASLPIAYNPATADFTVSAPGGDTTTVILTGLELPATGDPDRVALYYDTFDLWGETVDSMLVEVALMRTSPVYFGAELMESSWTMVDTTGTAPDDGIGPATPGRASAAIVRTSELQPMTTYKFRTRDLSTVRRLAGTLKTYPEVTGVTAPDSTSAGVAFNGR